MTRILLDTSGYSAFMRGHEKIGRVLQGAEEIYLSATILGELLAGFRRGEYRQKNEAELETFSSSPRVQVLDVDRETAERYAVILDGLRRSGTPIPTNDIWIAATAMQHGLRLVTTDRHYRHAAQLVVDLFE